MSDSPISPSNKHRCGTIALVGRPNVGKSTLLNQLIGFKLSIVSSKPQTTRHRILGIVTSPHAQLVYVDTPGLHRAGKQAMNRQLNRVARQTLDEVDVLVHVIEAGRWHDEDQQVWDLLAQRTVPRLLAINKIDRIKDKKLLLPFISEVVKDHEYANVYPVSAYKAEGLEKLEQGICEQLPIAQAAYQADEITDRSERFLVAERIREQLLRQLNQELPYATTVEIEQFVEEGNLKRIAAVIWVEREGQKAIVIGAGGEQLKRIGSSARVGIEKLLGTRIFLSLWVRVRENWADDEAALKRFGYNE